MIFEDCSNSSCLLLGKVGLYNLIFFLNEAMDIFFSLVEENLGICIIESQILTEFEMRLWILDIFKLNRFIEILEFIFLMHKYQILDIDETCRKCIIFDSVYSTIELVFYIMWKSSFCCNKCDSKCLVCKYIKNALNET